MIRSSRRGILPRSILIVAVAALGPIIAGCEAGTNAPTLQWHQPTDGTFQRVGKDLTISNAFVLGAPIGHSLRRGQNAGLYLGMVNIGTPDRLLAVKAPGVAQTVLLPGRGIPLRKLVQGPAHRPGPGDRAAAPGQAARRRHCHHALPDLQERGVDHASRAGDADGVELRDVLSGARHLALSERIADGQARIGDAAPSPTSSPCSRLA